MLTNKAVKDIQSLRDKKERDESGLFVAEGPKIVLELAAAAPQQVQHIYALAQWAAQHAAALRHLPLSIVDEKILERLSHLQTPNQVVAVLKHFTSIEPVPKNNLVLYLDTIQDPGNMGTIIRLADWFAVPHVVCSEGCADVYNAKVVQSTMASLARVNIWVDKKAAWLQKQAGPVFAAALDGSSLYETRAITEGVLIIGNESKGIRPEYLAMATQKITIPRRGHAESLNAAVATGIILSYLTPGPSPTELERGASNAQPELFEDNIKPEHL